MKFLQEALATYRRLEDAPELSLDDLSDTTTQDPDTSSELTLDPEDISDVDSDSSVTEDPDHQGLIRAVPGAHLVYKREVEDGTFEELWIYNITTLRDELDIRKAILAGTDIPAGKVRSPDGNQTYTMWSAGNAEMMVIQGLVQ